MFFSFGVRSYADDMGWTKRVQPDGSIVWAGFYRAMGLRWEGRIRQPLWGALQFEISNPPIAYIRQSRWAGCFHALSGPWMWITFRRAPTDVDSGIAAVNKLLQQVYRHRQRLGAL